MPWKKFLVFVASIALLFAVFFTTTYAQDKNKDKRGKSDSDDRGGNVVIAQISDTHIGLGRAPEASDNLRKVVEMVKNSRWHNP